MKLRFLTAAALLAAPAQSQEAPLRLSIEQALERAQVGSEAVTAARAALERAEAEKDRAKADLFPQVNGTASFEHTLESEFEIPAAAASSLPFGRDNTYRLGLSLSQLLYAGGRVDAAREMADAARDTAAIAIDTAKAQAALDSVRAYFDAVLADRLLAIARASLEQAEKTLAQAKLSRDAGTVPEFELLRARVTVDNQRAAIVQREADRTMALQRLRQLLDVPPRQDVVLTTGLDYQAGTEPVPVAETARAQADVPTDPDAVRAPVRQAEQTVRLREAAIDRAEAGHKPTVALVSNLGRNAYPDEAFPAWDDFRTNWTVGLQLQVPIFSGWRTSSEVRAAEADVVESKARLKQAEELAWLDTQNARAQLEAARAAWAATDGAIEQAQRAYELAELRYGQGVSTQLEVSDVRLALEQARANRARAARDLQVAKVRVALLPYLGLDAPIR
jgi:outer membrane protein TolC